MIKRRQELFMDKVKKQEIYDEKEEELQRVMPRDSSFS